MYIYIIYIISTNQKSDKVLRQKVEPRKVEGSLIFPILTPWEFCSKEVRVLNAFTPPQQYSPTSMAPSAVMPLGWKCVRVADGHPGR